MQPPTAYTAYTPTDAHVGTQLYTKYGTRCGVNVVVYSHGHIHIFYFYYFLVGLGFRV